MGNRTTYIDGNTWNNTHIALVGLVLISSEEEAEPLLASLDVDYVLVVFGGVSGYGSDDINKFMWPVRISRGVFPDRDRDRDSRTDTHRDTDRDTDRDWETRFYNDKNQFDVGANASRALRDSVT